MSPRIISDAEFFQREAELIEIARQLTEKECLTTLTIDKLVAASPYSKGTIYKHFLGKEDLMLAICNTCINEMMALFRRALTFEGNSRERMLAVMVSYIIWAKLHPSQLFAVLSAHSPSVTTCSSDARNQAHEKCESECMSFLNSEITQAIDSGDLYLPPDMSFEQLTFALWSSHWGAMALIMSKGNSAELKPMSLERESFTNTRLILDGLGWKPLSKDWDYKQSVRQIAEQIFAPEMARLHQNGIPFNFD